MADLEANGGVDTPRRETSYTRSVPRRLARHPLVKYLVIGGLSFIIDAGILWFCTSVVGWDLWVGATIGYWVGLLVNFMLNRLLMGRPSSSLVRQTIRYGILLGINFLVTLGFLHLAGDWGLAIIVAKTIIVAASTCWNYLLYRFWVFV